MRLRTSLQRARRRQGGGGGGNTAPGAPTIGTASAGNGTMSVLFTAPASNGGSAITGYTATLSTGETASGSSSPINFTGLANGVARTATVIATNAVGDSSPSASSNSVTTSSGATVAGAPTIGTATAGNSTVTITFTPPASNGGSAITSYIATLSTGATQTGSGSPIIFTGVTNGTPVTVTVKAVNGVGQSAASAASNSVTPAAVTSLLKAVTIENRVFNSAEGRTTVTGGTGWFTRTLHTIGSGNVKDICIVIDGYYKGAGSPRVQLANPFTINKMSIEIIGQPVVPVTFAGSRSYVVNGTDKNVTSDFLTATQIKAAVSLLPIGTEFWLKAEGVVAGVGAQYVLPSCVRSSADAGANETQFCWYNPANTTIVNGTDVAGKFTWTGTTPEIRSSGWAPMIYGHFEDGTNPVVLVGYGDSLVQGLQDNTAKRTGRGYFQYLLHGDGSSSASTGIRAGINLGVSGDTAASIAGCTELHEKMQFATDMMVEPGTNDIGQAGTGATAEAVHERRVSIVNAAKSFAVAGQRAPKVIVHQLQAQSTTGNPVKTINSAPNSGWGVGERSAQTNALALAAVGTDFTFYVPTPSVRHSADESSVDHYLWPKTGGTNAFDTNFTPDGQHYGNVGVVAMASDLSPTYRSIMP